ncbi:peptidylprolyl isomerase [Simiduia sp. 21SJ11W-1]|uniref:peptidylprolyl isomerase n=1 Tax=Simiduia sp. 21SJ11W-1 TaxID=2909669 RepID=UPI00209D58E7|nr:peptidylprolyl isomerase [Simiduia sp. 21SJ11W-1]UTA46545.1 peptidylprolyl isomerase [Simiduia sp. 21SJ11W-1]
MTTRLTATVARAAIVGRTLVCCWRNCSEIAGRRVMVIALCLWFLPMATFAQSFRTLEQANLWYLELETGQVVIELNDAFAPKTVAQIKRLTRAGVYDGVSFYRVIDGFVAQAGPGGRPLAPEIQARLGSEQVPGLPMEAVQTWAATRPYMAVQSPDMFAAHTAFVKGFAAGFNDALNKAWLLHCPGVVGIARGNAPDSATSDFYIVIGQAPRYLDGIMTLFGRVVWGMDKVQAVLRADPMGPGVIPEGEPQTRILSAAIGSDLPAEAQRKLRVEATETQAFKEKLRARKDREHPFFFKRPPAVLDACQVPVASTMGEG